MFNRKFAALACANFFAVGLMLFGSILLFAKGNNLLGAFDLSLLVLNLLMGIHNFKQVEAVRSEPSVRRR